MSLIMPEITLGEIYRLVSDGVPDVGSKVAGWYRYQIILRTVLGFALIIAIATTISGIDWMKESSVVDALFMLMRISGSIAGCLLLVQAFRMSRQKMLAESFIVRIENLPLAKGIRGE
ncbi:MAG: hypothetical protein R2684_05360 [Pyrinomonadaceae bacterium]